jgi:hypothetical protein
MNFARLVAALVFVAASMAVLTVASDVMQALIWEQSRGKPWVIYELQQRPTAVYPTLRDAVCSAEQVYPATGSISD